MTFISLQNANVKWKAGEVGTLAPSIKAELEDLSLTFGSFTIINEATLV